MSGPPPGAVWLPAQGPVQGRCDTCRVWGGLVLEHRRVWGALGESPHDAPAVRDGCPACQHRGQPRGVSRLVAQTDPPASLAGVMPKLSAREVEYLVCDACGHEAPCHWWAWVRCTTEGCTRESRGKLH